jgi:uncharacterized protein YggE
MALFGALLSAQAASADEISPREITMTGEGEVKAMPDEAVISAGAVTEAKTASEAVAANSEIMTRVFDALDKLGVTKSQIATNGFSLEPQYPPINDKDAEPRLIVGYSVSNSISVTTNDVAKAGEILDALIDAGANQSAGVNFDIKDPQPLLKQARALAGADALQRAETYAKSVGAVLGPVRTIREGYGGPRAAGVEAVIVTAQRQATPISAGEQSVSASVTISWAIK